MGLHFPKQYSLGTRHVLSQGSFAVRSAGGGSLALWKGFSGCKVFLFAGMVLWRGAEGGGKKKEFSFKKGELE